MCVSVDAHSKTHTHTHVRPGPAPNSSLITPGQPLVFPFPSTASIITASSAAAGNSAPRQACRQFCCYFHSFGPHFSAAQARSQQQGIAGFGGQHSWVRGPPAKAHQLRLQCIPGEKKIIDKKRSCCMDKEHKLYQARASLALKGTLNAKNTCNCHLSGLNLKCPPSLKANISRQEAARTCNCHVSSKMLNEAHSRYNPHRRLYQVHCLMHAVQVQAHAISSIQALLCDTRMQLQLEQCQYKGEIPSLQRAAMLAILGALYIPLAYSLALRVTGVAAEVA
eukprot:scaffold126472_cov20-Tisochrysis_lutea.AAC.3